MVISPIENVAIWGNADWIQKRTRLSQTFGGNAHIYAQFGMIGHNGIDFATPVGTPVFASFDGDISVRDQGDKGYGLHIKQRSSYMDREAVYAHLSEVTVIDGSKVATGELIGYTGNTGFSTGPHLHFGLRHLNPGTNNVWEWKVRDEDNGYFGYIDILPYMITYKGTYVSYSLTL